MPLAPLPHLAETNRSIHLYLFLYAETFTSPRGHAWVHSPQGQLAGEDALLQALHPRGLKGRPAENHGSRGTRRTRNGRLLLSPAAALGPGSLTALSGHGRPRRHGNAPPTSTPV